MATIFLHSNGMQEKREDLVHFRKKILRMTQEQLAEALEIPFGKYTQYEYRPEQKIDAEILAKLKKMGYKPGAVPELSPVTAAPTGTIKLMGAVAAGLESNTTHDGLVYVPIEFSRPYFSACICDGDSMMPILHHGDTLIFKDQTRPIARLPFAVRYESDNCVVVKEMAFKDNLWVLRSWNPAYEDRPLDGGQLLGYLVGIISRDGAFKIGPVEEGLTINRIEDYLRGRLSD
jgi:SOS-response transcriptional repressor LexA